ncbi:MATE family efflux transporter [uncultured Piscinibacter sp.]|uniref:MATE family efflux transporter n=1 Tax=uncultured Piscinibacter sp. TaxID=1131835 RepID=UPI00261DE635|nr:MATE family efflux transporter [uncultured Piscinibacter sp.]
MKDDPTSRTHDSLDTHWRQVLHLGWPISVQALATASFALVDMAMVQRLGPEAVAAVGLAGRGLFVLTMMLAGLANGAAVLLSQYAGRGESRPGARLLRWVALVTLAITLPACALALAVPGKVAGWLVSDAAVAAPLAAFLHAVALSIPLSALTAALATVSRCHGDSRSPMFAGLAGLGANAALDAMLIFGLAGAPALGVAGAGWATSAARALELALLLAAMSRPGMPARALLAALLERGWRSPGLVALAAPFMLQELIWSGSALAYGMVFAAMDAKALAMVSLLAPVEGLMVTLFVGGAVACGIVVGRLLGRQRFAAAQCLAQRALRRFGLAAVPVCAFAAVGAGLVIARLPWLEGQQAVLWTTLALSAVTVTVRVVAMTLVLGILRAGGDRRGVLMVELVGTVAVGLPLVTLAALRWGFELPQVLALLLAVEAGKMGALWRRMQRGVWRRSLLPQPGERATPMLCAGAN